MKFLLRSLLALSLITPVCAQDIIPPSPTATGIATTGQIPGTSTNDDAASGKVGEYISSEIPVGSAISLTTGTPANITSISLTPGDWDVWGTLDLDPGASAVPTAILGWASSTSAAVPTRPNGGSIIQLQVTLGANLSQDFPIGMKRFSLASTTTVYLSTSVTFSGGTLGAYGFIGARRIR